MKNRLKAFFSLAPIILSIGSTSCWAMEEDTPLTSITKRAANKEGPRVVFDIDKTMCIRPNSSNADVRVIGEKYPEAELMLFWNGRIRGSCFCMQDTYFFYPHYGEVFLTLLDWGWHVDFFSAEEKQRNEALIPAYLNIVLEPYSQDIRADYETLIQHEELKIFSYHHVSYKKNRVKAQYEQAQGDSKKDLTVVGPIQDTILVDDDPSSAMGGDQYPFIGICSGASHCFSRHLSLYLNKDYEDRDNPLNNASYILGVLAECKDLLDNKKAVSLRSALDLVLRNPHHVPSESPWFLSSNPSHNPKRDYWIEKGNLLIHQMRARAKSRGPEESKSNYTEIEVDESMFERNVNRSSYF